MSVKQMSRTHGFTLVELMIVVAIIGILASVAIPSFINYQLTAKRSEAFSNLASIAKAQKSYYAEFNTFVPVAAEPLGAVGVATTTKRDSTSVATAFGQIGWAPEGDVFFDYDTQTTAGPPLGNCGACVAGCFTSSAYGDLDGNGLFSILILAHPDAAGNYCTTGLVAGGGPYIPPLGPGGARELDMVTRVSAADRF